MKRRTARVRLGVESLESRTNPVTAPPGFQVVPVATEGFEFVTAMTAAPDGRIFATEKGGALRVIEDGALLAEPAITLTVEGDTDRGLLGLALDPDFESNNYIYLNYSAPNTGNGFETVTSRFTLTGSTIDPASERVVLRVPSPSAAHVAGMIGFGPDGKLYVSTGDNGFFEKPQTTDNLYGKLLRLNPDGTIPSDNPFYATEAGLNRAIYALGFRNPFTFAFEPGTGRLYVNDVGQNTWEEINEVVAGGNYGWPRMEGPDGIDDPSYTAPVYYYGHPPTPDAGVEGLGNSIVGGVFYDTAAAAFPQAYAGKYIYADLNGGWLRTFDPATGTSAPFISGLGTGTTHNALLGLILHGDGSLYFYFVGPDTPSGVYKIAYVEPATPPVLSLQPTNQSADAGTAATFTAAATGTDPLSYQWQRDGVNIPGATAASYTLSNPTVADDRAVFRVVVSNGVGTVASNLATLRVRVNTAPTAQILTPKAIDSFGLGRTYSFTGLGTDAEDGTLPESAYKWEVFFITGGVERPSYTQTGGAAGTFTLDDTSPYDDTDVELRFKLTVTDRFGSRTSTSVALQPEVTRITVNANIPGLNATTLGGQPFAGSVDAVVGFKRAVGALPEVKIAGDTFRFVGWSDGGAAVHDVPTPAGGFTLTARYRRLDPIVYGNGAGGLPLVQVQQIGSNKVNTFSAFESSFTGGVRVATADITGDGYPDIIAAAGPGGGPRVRVFDGTTFTLIADFFAFEGSFRGGVFVAAADLNGDGVEDLVLSPDVGGGPRVRILSGGDPKAVLADFFAIADANYRGGTQVALGDVSGNGVPDLIVGTSTDGPRVAVYDGTRLTSVGVGPTPPKLLADFFAFDSALRGGVSVAVADFNGDGFGDLIVGAGAGGGPRVTVLDGRKLAQSGGTRTVLTDFFAGDPKARKGVRVTAREIAGDGKIALLATAVDSAKTVAAFSWDAAGTGFTPAATAITGPIGQQWKDVYVG